ncbi:MAG: sugar ABC transporter substrate-binding protein [Clostridia bacterium]|nr:sugar ABC transporter substrate-binding protein [Clostridia bacterium]
MKKILSLLVALVLALGCAAMAEVAFVDEGYNYEIAENAEGKEVRIAVLMVNNNPFWVDVENGAKDIQKTMKKYNCTVDIQTIEDFDGQAFSDAIDNCIIMEYDGICTVGVSDAIIPAIERATAAGIRVYTFNSDTSEECSRVAFHGQSLYGAGELAGETLAQLIGGEGKVAIITGLFSVPAHELRRTGGLASFAKYEGIEVVGETECHDSGDEAYTQVMDFLTANPDLAGIYQTAGGQLGVIEALKESGMAGKVKYVCFDFMDEIVDALYDGIVNATIGQDPYGQGADPVIFAYNAAITGEEAITGNEWTKMDVVTPDNVAEYYPR